MPCWLSLFLALPLANAAQVELISGLNFGQIVSSGEASTDGVNFSATGSIRSNYAGNTVPGVGDSGYYRANNAIETSYASGVATLYWDGSNGSDAWTFASGVSAYEHGSFQAVNHNLVTGDTMVYGDDTNFALRFTAGANNEFALVVDTVGWSDFDPAAFSQPNDFNFTFSAFAFSGGTASIEWFLDGVSIGSFTANAGAHQAFNLNLPSSFYGRASAVLVARVTGDLVIDNIQINGVAAVPPVFTTQPADQTVNSGDNASFSVVVSGATSPTYQWEKDGISLTDGAGVSGATTANLTLTAVTPAAVGSYTVVVGNNGATAESSAAALAVRTAPVFTSQPLDVVANPDETATFSANVTGSPAPTYQWRKGIVDLVDGPRIAGATTATLVLTGLLIEDSGDYTLVATNAVNFVVSETATLNVTIDEVAPAIQQQPVATTVVAGGPAIFTIVASGLPAPTYQWRKDNVDLVDGDGISGATTDTLSITPASAASGGTYTVVVSNSVETVESDPALLTVYSAPVIISLTADQQVLTGGTATFTVEANGTPAPTYQWLKDGEVITGADEATYVITGVSLEDAADYSVVVTNAADSVTSGTSTLSVVAPPVITAQPMGRSVAAGAAVSFTVAATGTPTPTYQWYKDSEEIPGATEATFTLAVVAFTDAGSYHVVVSNIGGDVTSESVTLVVSVPVQINPTVTQTFAPGTRLLINSNINTTDLRFQWYLNGKVIPGATSSSYLIESATSRQSGVYQLNIYSAAGRLLLTQKMAVLNVTVAGHYDTLLRDPESDEPVGRLEIAITGTGAYSGRLLFEDGGSYALKGKFTLDSSGYRGTSLLRVKRAKGLPSLELDLSFDARAAELEAGVGITGDDDVLGAGVGAPRTTSAVWQGRYTLTLEPTSPSGDTITATAVIDAKGVLQLSGRMPDGKAFKVSVPGGTNASYAIFVQLYGKAGGQLAGSLNLVESDGVYGATFASSGLFTWFKPAGVGSSPGVIDLTFEPTLAP